jgi:hypothetical protein
MYDYERDKYLTLAMGHCFHERDDGLCAFRCRHCHAGNLSDGVPSNVRFDAWTGFGVLWPWAQKQDWFFDFKFWYSNKNTQYAMIHALVDPNALADGIWDYLIGKKHDFKYPEKTV